MAEKFITIIVEADDEGQRLDLLITGKLADISRSHSQKLISDQHVTVNGKVKKSNYKVRSADNVVVLIPTVVPPNVCPQAIPLSIIFEDASIIVINKPRGMVVHPAAGNLEGTLVNALLSHCGDLSGINGVTRPGIVHRLDKDTSGVMVAAKNDQAHLGLAEQIQSRTASRKYLAIVHGYLKLDQGVINAPIGRHPVDRKKMAVIQRNSKSATTNYRVLERFGSYTLVECKLESGRTHQIRVHMAYIGHPVVGDPKYGSHAPYFDIHGQALHSAVLSFCHPVSSEWMQFTAPVPQDMQAILSALRKRKGR